MAIIAVSLVSVPVSAASADYPDLVGLWKIEEDFITAGSSVNSNLGYEVSVRVPYINTITNSLDYVDWTGAAFILNLDGSDTDRGFRILQSYGSNQSIEYYNGKIYQRVAGHNADIVLGDEFYDDLRIIEFTDGSVTGWSGSSDPNDFYNNVLTYMSPYVPPQPRSLLDNILGTFSEVGSWIGTIISSLVALFWSVETASLTFLGILSVAGLAFSVIMLLFSFVTRFVGFSG